METSYARNVLTTIVSDKRNIEIKRKCENVQKSYDVYFIIESDQDLEIINDRSLGKYQNEPSAPEISRRTDEFLEISVKTEKGEIGYRIYWNN